MPKRKEPQDNPTDDGNKERGREGAKASRAPVAGNSIARPLLAMRLTGPQGVHAAASGHGRSSGASGGSQSGASQSSGGSAAGGGAGSGAGGAGAGGGFAAGGGAAGGAGGGGVSGGGAGGGGGMNPGGNGGRGNYGPSSPPTGSLPPFYESLKAGNNLANFANQYNGEFGAFLLFERLFMLYRRSEIA